MDGKQYLGNRVEGVQNDLEHTETCGHSAKTIPLYLLTFLVDAVLPPLLY